MSECVHVCVCVFACLRACVRVCGVGECVCRAGDVRARVCVCVCVLLQYCHGKFWLLSFGKPAASRSHWPA